MGTALKHRVVYSANPIQIPCTYNINTKCYWPFNNIPESIEVLGGTI